MMSLRACVLWHKSIVCAATVSTLFAVPCPAADESETQNVLLDVSVTVDFGRDEGQNYGSIFEVYDPAGNVVAGGGFLGAYNTEPRSDRGRLHFFLKPKQVNYSVETLPRVNDFTGVYLSDLGQRLYARSRSARDSSFYALDNETNEWRVDASLTAYDILVAGQPLHVSSRTISHAGQPILAIGDDRPNTTLREHYYASGELVLRIQDAAESATSNRLVACRWLPADMQRMIDPADGTALDLRSHGEFVYAFGQLGDEVLAATNTGGVYAFDGEGWRVIVEPGPHSYQVYSMLNYYDRLLLGHYPTGELYEYDGRELRHLPDWPPVMPGVQKRAREAQTLAIYGGELYAGVWPWGEVWRYDGNSGEWQFVRRMFSHPELTDTVTHPYETETDAVAEVMNLWGQRVTSLVPFGDSLYVSTSSKGGMAYDSKFAFLADGRWRDYGRVYRLTLPGQLAAPIEWMSGPTTIRCLLADGIMTIRQDGHIKASRAVDVDDVLPATPHRIEWGNGVYGPLAGRLLVRQSNLSPEPNNRAE